MENARNRDPIGILCGTSKSGGRGANHLELTDLRGDRRLDASPSRFTRRPGGGDGSEGRLGTPIICKCARCPHKDYCMPDDCLGRGKEGQDKK